MGSEDDIPKHERLAESFWNVAICSSGTAEEAAAFADIPNVGADSPHRWKHVEPGTLVDGKPYAPTACADHPGKTHYLFELGRAD